MFVENVVSIRMELQRSDLLIIPFKQIFFQIFNLKFLQKFDVFFLECKLLMMTFLI